MYKQAVLKIYYKDASGKLHAEPQGKFFYTPEGKPLFLADMTEHKVFRFCNGYAISKQILEAFSELELRPKVIYRRLDLNMLYITTPSAFRLMGIPGTWANHGQFILPLRETNWEFKPGNVEYEPKDLPVISVDDWKKTKFIATERSVGMDTRFTIPTHVKAEIRKRLGRKFPATTSR